MTSTAIIRGLVAGGWPVSSQATVAIGVLVVAALVLVAVTAAERAGEFPADLLWQFRLSSRATQLILLLGTGRAVAYGLRAVCGERRASEGVAALA